MEIGVIPGSITVVAVKGSVDGLTADGLVSALDAQVRAGNVRLVADCSALESAAPACVRC